MPFNFLGHIATADVAFEAWGETREELFVSAAAAFLRTMEEEPEAVERREELPIHLEHEELDLLLFAFLQELVFFKDARRLLLHVDSVQIEEQDGLLKLAAVARGEEITPLRHHLLVDIKAITLHKLEAVFENKQWKATVVMDI
jgi:SHS2 domain-containing protein